MRYAAMVIGVKGGGDLGCIQPYLVLGYFKTYLRGVGIDPEALRAGVYWKLILQTISSGPRNNGL
ncbi:hypothetical protein P029_02005 [Anaplasma phagocytophilum str. Norway variant2]|uniref:Uncharacterized protein n=2 Tax=Anaplasma phagocytophilum TaxID=948 RepID=A0A168H8Z6_ANAPH|nr:hypothetical protein P029_02005 [Anaplasma phagocytophilum str. Norway variant2]